MQFRKLGNSPLRIPVVSLGTMSVAPGLMHSAIDESQSTATVHAALDCGINFFDTAPAYGESEVRLGLALKDRRRDSFLIATKAGGATLGAAEIFADCEASLARLKCQYIDLYQIHWHKHVVPLSESVQAMQKLVEQGKVRHIGICNTGPIDLAEGMKHVTIASDQVVYNLISRAAEFSLLPMCSERGVGFLCYSPIAQGLLAGRYKTASDVPAERARSRHFNGNRPMSRHGEDGCETETFAAINKIAQIAAQVNLSMSALCSAWLLHQPGVTSILAGASTTAQVQANAATADITLSAETLTKLDEATAELKQKMGPNLDMWQGNSNSRVR